MEDAKYRADMITQMEWNVGSVYKNDEEAYIRSMDKFIKFNTFSNGKIQEPIELQYEHDLQWIKKQQNKEYCLETTRYKRLPQLTSKTLERFLNEKKLQFKTKSVVRTELEKRERSRKNWKSMKTSLLEDYVRMLPVGEETDALNEWNRRRMTRNEGRMKDWNDEKLDGYITMLRADGMMINEKENIRLQQNMMETRGLRKKSTEQMIQVVSKLEAETEELSQEDLAEVERYTATIEIDENREKNHTR